MNLCLQYEELLSAYIDDELDISDKKLVEEHIESCPNCADLLKIYCEISNTFDDSVLPAPPAICENVMEKVRVSEINKTSIFTSKRMILAGYLPLAACLGIALLVLPHYLNIERSKNDMVALQSDAPLILMDTIDDSDLTQAMILIEEAEMPAPAPEVAADDSMDENDIGRSLLDTETGAAGGNLFPDAIMDIDEDLLTEQGVIDRGYYAFIIFDSNLPRVVPMIEHGNFYLIKQTDIILLIVTYESYVVHITNGDENADYALVLIN